MGLRAWAWALLFAVYVAILQSLIEWLCPAETRVGLGLIRRGLAGWWSVSGYPTIVQTEIKGLGPLYKEEPLPFAPHCLSKYSPQSVRHGASHISQ